MEKSKEGSVYYYIIAASVILAACSADSRLANFLFNTKNLKKRGAAIEASAEYKLMNRFGPRVGSIEETILLDGKQKPILGKKRKANKAEQSIPSKR